MAQRIILTGEIQTGKTTALQQWLEGKQVRGILSPIVNGVRSLYAIQEGVYIPFQSPERSHETISVGRFHFYKRAFDQANEILLKEVRVDWCIIDEVGPLELQGQGFFPALEKLRINSSSNLLLVVRSSLLEAVQEKFALHQSRTITVSDVDTLTA
jgi:nucleoside-triphosphatase THEP1